MPASAPARLARANSLALSPSLAEALTVRLCRSHIACFDESSDHAFKERNGVARIEVAELGLV